MELLKQQILHSGKNLGGGISPGCGEYRRAAPGDIASIASRCHAANNREHLIFLHYPQRDPTPNTLGFAMLYPTYGLSCNSRAYYSLIEVLLWNYSNNRFSSPVRILAAAF